MNILVIGSSGRMGTEIAKSRENYKKIRKLYGISRISKSKGYDKELNDVLEDTNIEN